MRTLIIYVSYHHGNTDKIAMAMGEVLGAELIGPESSNPENLRDFDLIGFGSGNYFGRFDKRLVAFIDTLPRNINARAKCVSPSVAAPERG